MVIWPLQVILAGVFALVRRWAVVIIFPPFITLVSLRRPSHKLLLRVTTRLGMPQPRKTRPLRLQSQCLGIRYIINPLLLLYSACMKDGCTPSLYNVAVSRWLRSTWKSATNTLLLLSCSAPYLNSSVIINTKMSRVHFSTMKYVSARLTAFVGGLIIMPEVLCIIFNILYKNGRKPN